MDNKNAEKQSLFGQIEKMSPFPAILHMGMDILYFNELIRAEVGEGETKLAFQEHANQFELNSSKKNELSITTKSGATKWFEIISKGVEIDDIKIILSYFIDVGKKKKEESQIRRMSKLQGLMLDVTQKIFHLEQLQDIYEVILDASVQALDKANLGSVLIRNGDLLGVAASRGFSEAIKEFKLPLCESFLYQETKGLLNRIVYIEDLMGYPGYRPIKTSDGSEKLIRSTISTPIHVEGNFFGMISIDSVERDAFDRIDKNTMEFLKFNIEAALSNYFMYLENVSMAKHDSLTRLYNRRYFEEFVNLTIERSRRYEEEFSVVLIDIDALKKINDRLGHFIGDQAIKKIAMLLGDDTRKSDLLARIGGDEFVGVYLGISKQQLALKYEALRLKGVTLESEHGDLLCECSFSYGIANYPVDGITIDALIQNADRRMYQMKKTSEGK